ncbi:DUF2238 domain-containing protein [Erysipelothrix sp. HDW6A]|uniref:DUF2238 domain-containing protein n=1 Tax=Erysipelothrix sp. HDW6A TaxID=2714928 RepID=UPI0014090BF3|nr:DUF2238 domain-containing protein [Erysipelothrix sp. HDW6A]QIK58016.1 DUF2238 domain-containing protein [Erysipelothrix sp. HDW6A]
MKSTSKTIMYSSAILIVALFGINLINSLLYSKFVPLSNIKFVIGILLIIVPLVFRSSLLKRLSNTSITLYFLFIFFTLYLGETYGFYYKWDHFDSMLHIYSGGLLTLVSYEILLPVYSKSKVSERLLLLTSTTVSMTLGVFWEFYEYIFDGLMNLNMQRYLGLSERDVLFDTIKDMACNMLGISIVAIIIAINFRKKRTNP